MLLLRLFNKLIYFTLLQFKQIFLPNFVYEKVDVFAGLG